MWRNYCVNFSCFLHFPVRNCENILATLSLLKLIVFKFQYSWKYLLILNTFFIKYDLYLVKVHLHKRMKGNYFYSIFFKCRSYVGFYFDLQWTQFFLVFLVLIFIMFIIWRYSTWLTWAKLPKQRTRNKSPVARILLRKKE